MGRHRAHVRAQLLFASVKHLYALLVGLHFLRDEAACWHACWAYLCIDARAPSLELACTLCQGCAPVPLHRPHAPPLNHPCQVTVLDKSRADWKDFKKTDETIEEELEMHKRSGDQVRLGSRGGSAIVG